MARFNALNFMPLTSDGGDLDVFASKAKNMRFNVPAAKTITLSMADEHNLPGLAHQHLGDQSLWWVLLEYNGLQDPIKDIKAGLVMRIPSRRDLITYLETTTDKPTNVTL